MYQVPEIDWAVIARRIKRHWRPLEINPHIGFLAPSRTGKSYLIRHGILPIATGARTVLIDVKPGGERTWDGWGNDVTEIEPGFGLGDDGTANYRVMLMPGADRGKTQVKRVFDTIMREGNCILVMDDSRKISANSPNLGLAGEVDEILTDGAALGITVILAANSTVWSVSGLRDQCGTFFLGHMANVRQQKEFADVIDLPQMYREALRSIGRRQFLYSDYHDGELKLAITGIPEA